VSGHRAGDGLLDIRHVEYEIDVIQMRFPGQGTLVRYVSSEEFISSIGDGKGDTFRKRYREMDILLVATTSSSWRTRSRRRRSSSTPSKRPSCTPTARSALMAERRSIYNQVTELTNRIKNGEPRMTASRAARPRLRRLDRRVHRWLHRPHPGPYAESSVANSSLRNHKDDKHKDDDLVFLKPRCPTSSWRSSRTP
jgi:hypothetical protein